MQFPFPTSIKDTDLILQSRSSRTKRLIFQVPSDPLSPLSSHRDCQSQETTVWTSVSTHPLSRSLNPSRHGRQSLAVSQLPLVSIIPTFHCNCTCTTSLLRLYSIIHPAIHPSPWTSRTDRLILSSYYSSQLPSQRPKGLNYCVLLELITDQFTQPTPAPRSSSSSLSSWKRIHSL
ncbi:uncharacterized protein BP01DRAFT_355277 [Aspergillus saccharolyticus JOP 1030-1]|uniref:Uncharacterized protein n=1 Tax=Aspergillus saccharolyticus JOP 1030-1 TaxID=1450539 RepID=A0A318ZJ22_9EURO|nr:hypothetical protein BP01DRAFT_355277 [Aspergillus saccharolyticus JOP 1030-1]PYH46865.1 hypothetical protein BP01DRAFT_355277 [Aspergillus saccharolyticus JOP 1030-1]